MRYTHKYDVVLKLKVSWKLSKLSGDKPMFWVQSVPLIEIGLTYLLNLVNTSPHVPTHTGVPELNRPKSIIKPAKQDFEVKTWQKSKESFKHHVHAFFLDP